MSKIVRLIVPSVFIGVLLMSSMIIYALNKEREKNVRLFNIYMQECLSDLSKSEFDCRKEVADYIFWHGGNYE